MIRKFTLLVLCGMMTLGALAQPTAVIKKASVNPVIDGEIDDVWAESDGENYIDQAIVGQIPTLGVSTWQGLWTDEGVWILVTVDDDAFYPHYAADPVGTFEWQHDKPEIYFDVNYILQDGFGPNTLNQGHYQVAPGFTDGKNDGTLLTAGFNAEAGDFIPYAFMVEDPSYIAEYFVPFEFLTDLDGNPIDLTEPIGFDVYIIDRDPGEEGDGRNAVWANTGETASSWNNMDDCGTITFEGAQSPVYIESITLSGETEITENNGTLKIVAEVLPIDYNEGLKWLVTDGVDGGMAKIDRNGVVTALVDGTVTVTCQSASLSVIETMEVNISNQIVSVPEHNLIRNGYFEKVNPDGSIPEWSLNGVGENPPFVSEDGYVVLDPNPGGEFVYDFSLGQQNFGCNNTDGYTFSFVAWADDVRTFNVDFEAPVDPYIRYGTSTHPFSPGGESDWTFDVTDEPVHYVFDVIFDRLTEDMSESLNFMLGTSGTVVYLDSVVLINDNILDLIDEYTAVTSITVDGAEGANSVPVGNTLQMSALVLPAEADYPDVKWVVEPGTGWATIDESGLLTADTLGTVIVKAMAKDDSGVMGTFNVSVTWPLGIDQQQLNSLKVYPNPAVDKLYVELSGGESSISIYNSVGMKMDEVIVSGTQHTFDISSYAAGFYFVRTEQAVARFVK